MPCRIFLMILVFFAAGVRAEDEPKRPIIDVPQVKRALAHLTSIAEANAGPGKKQGDDLAELYVRETAAFCVRERIGVREYLVVLGVGLDASDFLRQHPLTRARFDLFEEADARGGRTRVIGSPTLRGRPDLLLHFALSAALTASGDAAMAEVFGVAKELRDATTNSGFSFVDLAADYSGIALASHLLERPERLAEISTTFRAAAFLPPLEGLEEGMTLKVVSQKYGPPGTPKFLAACRAVQERVRSQAIYRKASEGR